MLRGSGPSSRCGSRATRTGRSVSPITCRDTLPSRNWVTRDRPRRPTATRSGASDLIVATISSATPPWRRIVRVRKPACCNRRPVSLAVFSAAITSALRSCSMIVRPELRSPSRSHPRRETPYVATHRTAISQGRSHRRRDTHASAFNASSEASVARSTRNGRSIVSVIVSLQAWHFGPSTGSPSATPRSSLSASDTGALTQRGDSALEPDSTRFACFERAAWPGPQLPFEGTTRTETARYRVTFSANGYRPGVCSGRARTTRSAWDRSAMSRHSPNG